MLPSKGTDDLAGLACDLLHLEVLREMINEKVDWNNLTNALWPYPNLLTPLGPFQSQGRISAIRIF